MAAPDLQWISLADFTPGIQHRPMSSGNVQTPGQPGAATEQNTYRCIGLPGGGLGPLPRQIESYSRSSNLEASEPTYGYYVSGFYVAGPISPAAGGTATEEYYFAYEYGFGGNRRYRLERYRNFEASPTLDSLKNITSTHQPLVDAFRSTTFGTTRSNRTTPANPGVPVVVAAWYQGSDIFVSTFPDDAAPTTVGMFNISTTRPSDILVHQGRVILLELTAYGHGPTGAWSTNEDIGWTAPNNVSSLQATKQVVVPENPSGYAAWASMSAQELLLIKQAGGGLTINGDINDDTVVVNLPNITPLGLISYEGANTPFGFVYGTYHGGVWVWQGGDTSVKISQRLDDDLLRFNGFVRPTGGPSGTFARWYDWVICPNNWVFDTNAESWWRIEDPSLRRIVHWRVAPEGFGLLGAVQKFSNASPIHMYKWGRTDPAFSFSWQSQPLSATMNRQVNVRELVLVVQGTGTVTVTLTGLNGTTRTETFSGIAATYPLAIRRNTQLYGTHIMVRIESDGGASAAPTIYELRVGVDERMKVA